MADQKMQIQPLNFLISSNAAPEESKGKWGMIGALTPNMIQLLQVMSTAQLEARIVDLDAQDKEHTEAISTLNGKVKNLEIQQQEGGTTTVSEAEQIREVIENARKEQARSTLEGQLLANPSRDLNTVVWAVQTLDIARAAVYETCCDGGDLFEAAQLIQVDDNLGNIFEPYKSLKDSLISVINSLEGLLQDVSVPSPSALQSSINTLKAQILPPASATNGASSTFRQAVSLLKDDSASEGALTTLRTQWPVVKLAVECLYKEILLGESVGASTGENEPAASPTSIDRNEPATTLTPSIKAAVIQVITCVDGAVYAKQNANTYAPLLQAVQELQLQFGKMEQAVETLKAILPGGIVQRAVSTLASETSATEELQKAFTALKDLLSAHPGWFPFSPKDNV